MRSLWGHWTLLQLNILLRFTDSLPGQKSACIGHQSLLLFRLGLGLDKLINTEMASFRIQWLSQLAFCFSFLLITARNCSLILLIMSWYNNVYLKFPGIWHHKDVIQCYLKRKNIQTKNHELPVCAPNVRRGGGGGGGDPGNNGILKLCKFCSEMC